MANLAGQMIDGPRRNLGLGANEASAIPPAQAFPYAFKNGADALFVANGPGIYKCNYGGHKWDFQNTNTGISHSW